MALAFRPHSSPRRQGSRATFSYELSDDGILQIIDLDHDGAKSVTNDIENVLLDIAQHEGPLGAYRVIYRDSTQRWDGIKLDEHGHFQSFYPIGVTDQAEALKRVRG